MAALFPRRSSTGKAARASWRRCLSFRCARTRSRTNQAPRHSARRRHDLSRDLAQLGALNLDAVRTIRRRECLQRDDACRPLVCGERAAAGGKQFAFLRLTIRIGNDESECDTLGAVLDGDDLRLRNAGQRLQKTLDLFG